MKEISINIPNDIIECFSTRQNIFSAIEIPVCPNCHDCNLTDVCKTKGNYELSKNIAKKMISHPKIEMVYIEEFC